MDIGGAVPKIFAYEALLRIGEPWCSLELEAFIAKSERNRTIANVDAWVAAEACKILSLFPEMRMSINASQISVSNDEYIAHVIAMATKHKCADRLVVEVTETAQTTDDSVAPGLQLLSKAAVAVMIDDVFDSFAKRHLVSQPFITGCKISRKTMVTFLEK